MTELVGKDVPVAVSAVAPVPLQAVQMTDTAAVAMPVLTPAVAAKATKTVK